MTHQFSRYRDEYYQNYGLRNQWMGCLGAINSHYVKVMNDEGVLKC